MEITHPTGTVFTKIYFFRQQKEVGEGGGGGGGGGGAGGGDKGEDYMSATELLPRKVSIEHVLEFYFN